MSFEFTGGLFGPAAGNSIEYVYDGLSLSDAGEFNLPFDTSFFGVAGVNGNLQVDYDFFAGLIATAHLDLGGLTGATAFSVTADLSQVSGSGATITTTVTELGDNVVEATGPSAEDTTLSADLKTDLVVDVSGTADAYYDIFFDDGHANLYNFDHQTLVDWHDVTNLFTVSAADLGGLDGEVFQVDTPIGTLIAAVPEFEYDDAEAIDLENGLQALHVSGASSAFLSLELDLDSFLLPVGNSFDFGLDAGFMAVGIDVGLLDAKLVAGLSLGQDITYTPTVDVTMVSDLGETLTGALGDEMTFDTPEGEGDLSITATYEFGVDVASILTLDFSTQIDWKIFYGEIEFVLDVYVYQDRWSTGFAAVEGSEPLEDLGFSLELFNDTSHYDTGEQVVTYTLHYENFVTATGGANLTMTTNQTDLMAGTEDNVVTANLFGNNVDAEQGDDTVYGQDGDDTVQGNDGDDELRGNKGGDSLDGGTGDDIIFGSNGDDTLYGGDGNDMLNGGSGNDAIYGGGENDTIEGNHGDDIIFFGLADDLMSGGAGADTFELTFLYQHDTINKLRADDWLDFRWSRFQNINEVLAEAHQVGKAVVPGDDVDNVTFNRVSLADFAAANFLFDPVA